MKGTSIFHRPVLSIFLITMALCVGIGSESHGQSISVPPAYTETWEGTGTPANWTLDSPWYIVTLPAAQTHSGDADSKVLTDSPGSYSANADTSAQVRVHLGGASMPVLMFWHRCALESGSDWGYVEVQEVGTSTWKRLYGVTGTSAWKQEKVDLADYAGKEVDIRFRLKADSNGTQSDGWYIDDLSILPDPGASPFIYPFSDDMETSATEQNWFSSSWELINDPLHGKVFTDSPGTLYGDAVYSSLILSNAINLPDSTTHPHPQLTFWHKHNFSVYGSEYDKGRVYLSTYKGQPGTWVLLQEYGGIQDNWTYQQIDLSQWAGLPDIRIKFEIFDHRVYTSEQRQEGWTVDDVSIEDAPFDVTLSITATAQSSVSLSWSQNTDQDFDRYEIYRSSSASVTRSSTRVATITGQSTVSYIDPVAMIQPGVYFYRVYVFDQDGNSSMGSNVVQATYTIPENHSFPFSDDAEGSAPLSKWSFGYPWGLTTAQYHLGGSSWTDSPGGNYANNADTSLDSFVDLSTAQNPVLTFWHRYYLEEAIDFVYLEISTDGGQTWTVYRTISGVENNWNQERVNLTSCAGNARVGIRFRLVSDSQTTMDGYYLDDLAVTQESNPMDGVRAHYPFDDTASGIPWWYDTPWGLITVESHVAGVNTTAWTDSPEGNYAPNEDTWLKTSIDLTSADMPVLSFWHRYGFALNDQGVNSDFAYIEVREGTEPWKRLYFVTGTSAVWLFEKVDLSDYGGKVIELRFRLVSDGSYQSYGWIIDDIRIEEAEVTPAIPYPFIDHFDSGTTANWITSSWELTTDKHSGTNAVTDSRDGNYGDEVYSSMILARSIHLPDSTTHPHPQLTFWHKHNFSVYGSEYDKGRVYLSTYNGQPGTWVLLQEYGGIQDSWTYRQIDLSQWAGLPDIRIKFEIFDHRVYTSEHRQEGWTIDDVSIEDAPKDVPLAITTSSQSSVTLSWLPNTENDFARYEIYRSTSPGVTRSSTHVATLTNPTPGQYVDAVAMVQPTVYYYRMWVIDQNGNISIGSNEEVAWYTVPSNGFPLVEDDQGGTGRWSFGSPWGLSDISPHSGSYCWSDSPAGNYSANANTSLETYIDLSGSFHPVLTYWNRYSLEEGKDFVLVEVSTDDGATWAELHRTTGTDLSWNQERINLSPYSGYTNLGLRFRLISDGSNQQDGWYMDDLQISEGPVSAPYPFFYNMENGLTAPWFFDSPWGLQVLPAGESHPDLGGAASTVWSDSPAGSYAAGEDTWLQLSIDLGAANMPVLSFWHKCSFDTNYDYGFIQVREGGTTTWERLFFITGTHPWAKERVDLSDYAGKNIDLRFRVVADTNGVQGSGWLIDDISIAESLTPVLPYPFTDEIGEGSDANWQSSSWGLVSGSHIGTGGGFSFTDSPQGFYGDAVYSALTMAGAINLIGAVHPTLSFWHKYRFSDYGSEHDKGQVYLSTFRGQPGTWVLLREFGGIQDSSWTEVKIDLSQWAGLSDIRIKFEIFDHRVYTSEHREQGWTIDDIRIGEDLSIESYIVKVSGDNQNGLTQASLGEPFMALVRDTSTGLPRAGVQVDFAVVSGGGFLSEATDISDTAGRVSTTLTLGANAGQNTVSATVNGSTASVIFSATGFAPGQPFDLEVFSGDNQTGAVNTTLAAPLKARLTDISGNIVPGVNVVFISSDAGSTLGTSDPVPTDSFGIAENTLTIGEQCGSVVVSASAPGVTPVSFTAYGVLPGGSSQDYDGDGMPNSWEDANGFNPRNPDDAADDPDHDGLRNLEEFTRGTKPWDADTDDDGMPDGWEVMYGLNPLYAGDRNQDSDSDGVSNYQEYVNDTLPIFPRHFQLAGVAAESMDFYGLVTINGIGAEVGDEVAAFDSSGVCCGRFTVETAGQYGFMAVYRNDPHTSQDEGADPGEVLSFKVWDRSEGVELPASVSRVVTGTVPPSWTADGDFSQVDLGVGKQIIPLHTGWNLISFSLKTCYYVDGTVSGYTAGEPAYDGGSAVPMLTGTTYQQVASLADVFASIDGLYDVVRSFDAAGAHTFDPALPSFSSMKYVAGGYGYWIKMRTPGNLEVHGIGAVPSDTLALNVSWNLIGYWHPGVQYVGNSPPLVAFPQDLASSAAVTDIDEILAAIQGDYYVIRSHDINGAHTYDPMLGSFNTMRYLGPGYGMWIKMRVAGALHY